MLQRFDLSTENLETARFTPYQATIWNRSRDEFSLSVNIVAVDVSNLSLFDHPHRLKARQRSSRRPEAAKGLRLASAP